MSEYARHSYDGSVAGADDAWEERFQNVEIAHHVYFERVLDFIKREIEEGFTVYDCSVVD